MHIATNFSCNSSHSLHNFNPFAFNWVNYFLSKLSSLISFLHNEQLGTTTFTIYHFFSLYSPLFSTPFTFNIRSFSIISTGQKSSTASTSESAVTAATATTEASAANRDDEDEGGLLFLQNSQSLDNLRAQGYQHQHQRIPDSPPPSYSTLEHTTSFRRILLNDSSTTSNSSSGRGSGSGTSSTSSYDFEDYFPNNDGLRVHQQHQEHEIDTRSTGARIIQSGVDGKDFMHFWKFCFVKF